MSTQEAFGWSEGRVETLKTLWGDGLSASQIASRLGGVSRNAVIGKVHRLNLPGRKCGERKPKRQRALRFRPTRTYDTSRRTAEKPTRAERVARIMQRLSAEMPAPEMPRIDLLSLTATSCRFPLGLPKQPGFAFCGRLALDGLPYCDHHARIACRLDPRRTR